MFQTSNIQNKDQEVKEEILQAAETVFQKWGLTKTTMEDIAHQANKGKSTLYYYYKSKEEIFETVVTKQIEKVLLIAKENTEKVKSSKEKLRVYIVTSLEEISKFALIYSVVRDEIRGNRTFIEKIAQKIKEAEKNFIKEILLTGIKTKEISFKEDELDVVATTCLGIIEAIDMYLFIDNRDNIEIDKKIQIVARLITGGL